MNTNCKRNARFREYVTSTSFQLTLSRNMIGFLAALDAGDQGALLGFSYAVPTGRCLASRGLVEHEPSERGFYRLTEAGFLTVEMLKCAGLIVSASDTANAA